MTIRIVIQGWTDAAAIVAPRIKVHSRSALQLGMYVACERGGGDYTYPRDVRVDLDESNPTPHYFAFDQEVQDPFMLSVSQQRVEVVDLRVTASERLYEWTAELDVFTAGRQDTITVDDNGRPFRLSGAPNSSQSLHQWIDGRWQRVSSG
jgi:hypothetical protein